MGKTMLRELAMICGIIFCASRAVSAQEKAPIRVALVGLAHGHASGLLRALPQSKSAKLVAIVELQAALQQQYAGKFHLDK